MTVKEKTLQPIMIDEDSYSINKSLFYMDKYVLHHCSKIQESFEMLNIGDMTDEHLKDILFNNCKKIENRLIEKAKEETENEFLVDQAVKKAVSKIDNIRNAWNEMNKKCSLAQCTDLFDYLSVSENKNIVFSKESKNELVNVFRTFVTSEKGIKNRILHEKIASLLNQLKDATGWIDVDVLNSFDVDFNGEIICVPMNYG